MIILFGLTITKSREVESDISITVLNILVSQKRNQNQAISRPGYSQDPELDHTNSKKMSKLLRSVQYNS